MEIGDNININDRLSKIHKIALDTNCFIYFFEDNKYADILESVFNQIQAGCVQGITSVLTLTEILTQPKRLGNNKLENNYRLVLKNFPGLALIDINPAIAEAAADLRTAYGIRTPDALHLASAIYSQADAFLTNDKRFKQVAEIPVWLMEDCLLPAK